MAMLDYGAILVRDGKRMNDGMFMGKTDTGYVDDNFTQDMFVCVGDGNILIGAYKCMIVVEFNGQAYKFFCGYTFKSKRRRTNIIKRYVNTFLTNIMIPLNLNMYLKTLSVWYYSQF